jgi:hypothetical protein
MPSKSVPITKRRSWHASHPPGALVARSFVGARSARAFLHDKENNSLLYPAPSADSCGLTGFITQASSVNSLQNGKSSNMDAHDFAGKTLNS